MADFWSTREFRKLKAEWYDKLAKEGFHDIELHDRSMHTDTARFADMEAVRDYYMKVSEYLHIGEFKTPVEKTAWFIYQEGYSIRNIAKILKLSRKSVTTMIESHVKKMEDGK